MVKLKRILFSMIVFVCTQAESMGNGHTNLIANSGFEKDEKGIWPTGWRYEIVTSSGAEAEYIKSGKEGAEVYGGSRAVALRGGMNLADRWFMSNESLPQVVPGKSYRLSVWVKCENFENSGHARLSMNYLDQSRKSKGLPMAPSVTTSGNKGWHEISFNFKVPPNVYFIRPSLSMFCSGDELPAGARAVFDNVMLLSDPEPEGLKVDPVAYLTESDVESLMALSGVEREPIFGLKDFSGWKSVNGKVELKNAGQALHVICSFPEAGPVRLLPPRPLELPPDTQRIRTWLARVDGIFTVKFVLRDGQGVEHVVKSLNSYPFMGSPSSEGSRRQQQWSIWEQHYSVNISQPSEEELTRRVISEKLDQARRCLWPKPIRLEAVEIHPIRKSEEDHSLGAGESSDSEEVEVGARQPSSGRAEFWMVAPYVITRPELKTFYSWYNASRWRVGWDEPSVVFPDDFIELAGNYRYRLEIVKGYQGPILWRREGEFTVHRTGDPLRLFREAVIMPSLPKGFYTVLLKSWDESELLREQRFSFYVQQSSVQEAPPVLPIFEIETGQKNHVFPVGTEQATLNVKKEFVPAGAEQIVLKVEDWRGDEVFNRTFSVNESVEAEFRTRPVDYYASAAILDSNNRVLDRARLHFGVAYDSSSDAGFATPTSVDLSKAQISSEYNRPQMSVRFSTYPDAPWTPLYQLPYYDNWLTGQILSRGFRNVSLMLPWSDIEVLPGVHRWEEPDRRSRLAASLGLDITAWFGVLGKWPPWAPDWWWGDLKLSQFGRSDAVGSDMVRSRNSNPAMYDENGDYLFLRWYEAGIRHVRGDPAVTGYKMMIPSIGRIGLPRAGDESGATDYSDSVQKIFDAWLIKRGETPYPIPGHLYIPGAPQQNLGPDLSKEWQDLCRFSVENTQEIFKQILGLVRSLDPVRPVAVYRSLTPAFESLLPLMKESNAYFFDESAPNFFSNVHASMSDQAGVKFASENHFYMPSSREIVDANIFYGAIYNQGWSYSYRWHERHKGVESRFYDSLDYVAQAQPLIEQYASARGSRPQVLVFGSRMDQMLNNDQSTFFGAISGIDLFVGLFSYFQILPHFANEFTDWINLEDFKLVFVRGDVMSQSAIHRVAAYARQGGKVVVVGNAGRYCPEMPEKRNCLTEALDGLPKSRVRFLEEPVTKAPLPGRAPESPYSADPDVMSDLLNWADVTREVFVVGPENQLDARFECLIRRIDEDSFYVSVFRRAPYGSGGPYNGWYNELMLPERTLSRWGLEVAEVEIHSLDAGRYCIEKVHRETKKVGVIEAARGQLKFKTDPSRLGELQIYRVTKQESGLRLQK